MSSNTAKAKANTQNAVTTNPMGTHSYKTHNGSQAGLRKISHAKLIL